MGEPRRYVGEDLRRATFEECDLRDARIVSSWVSMDVTGMVERLVVNDVDVTGYVEDELDRRLPARRLGRAARTPAEHVVAWAAIREVWAGAVERARQLPEGAVHERVDGEWSFVETLRHLVFVVDVWARRTILDEERPFHPLALPHTQYPRDLAIEIGVDVDGRSTLDEALAAVEDRFDIVTGIVAGLTATELDRPCSRPPAPGYPEVPHPASECLLVVYVELCEHLRFATRDLAVLEGRT